MIHAIIPAAGLSTRMGRPKLLLPFGDGTVLAAVIRTIQAAGIADVLVVLGPHQEDHVPAASEAGAHVVVLPRLTADMRETVQEGLNWCRQRFNPDPAADQWLLCPADHPTLNADVVRRLVQARAGNPAMSIVLPTHAGRRGHPVLVDWKHADGLQQHPADQGINTYLRRHTAETLEVPVDTPDILIDLDTPEDYEQLQRRLARGEAGPSRDGRRPPPKTTSRLR